MYLSNFVFFVILTSLCVICNSKFFISVFVLLFVAEHTHFNTIRRFNIVFEITPT